METRNASAPLNPRPIRVSVCSPAHNEAKNLPELVRRVHAAMERAFGANFEQVIVDDGSTDDTWEVLGRLAESHPRLVRLRHERNLGERAAWKSAFEAVSGEIIVLLAADLQSPPEEIPRLLEVLDDKNIDVGTGWREQRQDGWFYSTASRVLTAAMDRLFDLQVRDASSSFFAARREFLEDMPLVANDHRYILAILRRRGARVHEIPVAHASRHAGNSHYQRSKVLRAIPEFGRFTMRLLAGYYDAHSPGKAR